MNGWSSSASDSVNALSEAAPLLDSFATIRSDVLLLGGARSIRDLRVGLDELARILPHARRVTLAGVGHTAALDEDKPELVARELRSYFIGHDSLPVSTTAAESVSRR